MQLGAAAILTVLMGICAACLITNCPKGGKRIGPHIQEPHSLRQCARSGTAKLGHRYGRAICCGPQFGCLVATPEIARCLTEAGSLIPCTEPTGAQCGEGNFAGRCTANGVCCTDESCRTDKTCRVTVNNAEELTDGYAEQTNPLYSLYNAISSSYQQDNPGLVFTPPDGD